MVDRLVRIQEARGSNPLRSTGFIRFELYYCLTLGHLRSTSLHHQTDFSFSSLRSACIYRFYAFQFLKYSRRNLREPDVRPHLVHSHLISLSSRTDNAVSLNFPIPSSFLWCRDITLLRSSSVNWIFSIRTLASAFSSSLFFNLYL